MDNHDKAHYGIAGSLAAVMSIIAGAGYSIMPSAGPSWPKLDAKTADMVVIAVSDATPKHEFGVYCADAACTKISHALLKAGKRHGAKVNYESLLGGFDGLQVGAPTHDEAVKLKDAVEKASGGVLAVADVYGTAPNYYVSFGHIVPAE